MPIDTFELNEMVFDYDPDEVYSDWIESVREYQDLDEDDFLEGVGGNRSFTPFDPIGVEYLREACDTESQQITAIGSGELGFAELFDDEDRALSNGEGYWWQHLDLGVRGVVLGIREIGGFPFTSCNAGCFRDDDGHHAESHPIVAFYGNHSCIQIIENAARENGCGLYSSGRSLVLYTNDIVNLNRVATHLLESAERRGPV